VVDEQPVANSYDSVPYCNLPHSFTHPRCLETMAALFRMQPPDIHHCRVLELGCGRGGNLIPLAFDLPESQFLGVDLSQRQVEEGQGVVKQLGLSNIELRQANILDIDASWGQFDYLIVHGVYSWLPPPVQDKLLEVSCRNLSPNGVAFISYNTYPGWHMANVVRDLMRYHTAHFNDPQQQIAQAKAMLALLAGISPASNSFGKLLREELDFIQSIDRDSYLFHDHLEVENHPVYFYEFIERAESKGLQYLADSDFGSMLLQNLPAATHAPLGRLPLIPQEQYMDFARGRRFRRTLLCHQGITLQRHITAEQMPLFHFVPAGPLTVDDVDIHTDQPAKFSALQSTMTTRDRLLKAAMIHLKETYPRYVGFRALYATALARLGGPNHPTSNDPALSAESLAANLLSGYCVGFFQICLHPPQLVVRAGRQPAVNPLARLQAENGLVVTNRLHEPVTLNPLSRRMVRRLDGNHDRRALVECVREAISCGELNLQNVAKEPAASPGPKTLSGIVDEVLANVCSAALLTG
jgi:methyltransferase-like protein/2-polyprenyl-3-methyl-5-hydroxy-6-metoxy-1,4-benzoquinol methylase